MFCPNCGKQIPDNSAFCSECGKSTAAPAAAPASEPTPAPAAAPAAPATPAAPAVGKIKYFTQVAPKNKRILAGIAIGLGLLCILFVFLSTNTTVNGSIFELPVLSMLGFDEVAEYQDDLDKIVAEGKNADISEIEELVSEVMDVNFVDLNDKKDEVLDLLSPLSLSSMVALGELVGGPAADFVSVLDGAISGIWGFAAFLMILTALGVLFQKTWIMVLSYILGALFIFFTGGLVYLVLASIAYITTAVLFSKMKFAYAVYLASNGVNL